MPDPKKTIAAVLLVIGLAAGLRFTGLAGRPMHTDEAVHAVKFGELLEGRGYAYDPQEYHGPTLNYLTLVPAFLSGQRKLEDLTETTLRAVPAFFGTALLLWMLLLVPVIGRTAVLGAVLFAAVSPSLVFYSRYYIQETLLLFFMLGMIACIVRYGLRPSFGWAAAAGLCAGLTHATKETCVIAWAAAAAAGFVFWGGGRKRTPDRPNPRWTHAAFGVACAAFVSALFFSSFFSHPAGVRDSLTAYGVYLGRAGESVHLQPWFYYFHILGGWKAQAGPVWSEAPVLFFGMIGIVSVFGSGGKRPGAPERAASRFLVLFTVILTVAVSAIPYKTPWNLLLFWGGWMILAGIGLDHLLRRFSRLGMRAVVLLAFAASVVFLLRQSLMAVTAYDSDPRNPYVYSHPGPDLEILTGSVLAAADASSEGRELRVDVIVPEHGYW
ncbi:TIGR03663 family protein, partial [bacterium]|nr:TIGR03663 family protein [bacterium]